MEGGRDEGFPGSGRGVEDHVAVLEQLKDRLLLRWVQGESPGSGMVKEASEQRIAAGGGHPDQLIVQGHWAKEATGRDEEHGLSIVAGRVERCL
jgi:hypothetical protein